MIPYRPIIFVPHKLQFYENINVKIKSASTESKKGIYFGMTGAFCLETKSNLELWKCVPASSI